MTGQIEADVDVLVVGAGVAGLAAGLEAAQFGDAVVVEARPRVGGAIASTRVDGYLLENAAASFNLPASGVSTIVATCGLDRELVAADAAARRRWLYLPFDKGKRLEPLPMHPLGILRSPIVSPWAKLGAIGELLTSPNPDGREESVSEFMSRRFGCEISGRLAQPMISGIFAGRASSISVDAAFPTLRAMEGTGGLIRSGLRRMKLARAAKVGRPRLHSFRDGMQRLPAAMSASLGERVMLETPVVSIERLGSRWRVETPTGTIVARNLALANEPETAAKLLAPVDSELSDLIADTTRAPVAVVYLGVPAQTLSDHKGFGYLNHPRSTLVTLGAVFDSAIFPDRAPKGYELIRVLAGGRLDPELVDLDDSELVETAARDLAVALGRNVEPVFSRVARHRIGIPQYELGHAAKMTAVNDACRRLGRLALVGWGYRGVGVNTTIADAIAQVRTLV